MAPVVESSLDGRWGLPPRGLDASLPIFGDEGGTAYDESRGGIGRVLWLGEPSILPAAGVALDERARRPAGGLSVGVEGATTPRGAIRLTGDHRQSARGAGGLVAAQHSDHCDRQR